MSRTFVVSTIAALSLLVSASPAPAHTIPWREGVSRTVGFGHCAKGPCIKRSSFARSVPHRHVGTSQCEGMGASGLTSGRRFKC
jgi:hypothetical protein